ncbi:MAG: hypothetical protein U0838_15950 [Chloroflexota bacterium]
MIVALAAAPATGMGAVLGGGEPSAPTADWDVDAGARAAAVAEGLVTHVGPIITSDVFYDPHPTGSPSAWGQREYMGVEMESAALFLIMMRERAKAGQSAPGRS